MMWENRHDLIAGPVTMPAVQWTVGCLYDHDTRRTAQGRGVAVELPVVFQLLDLITQGVISAEQAKGSFAPVLADLAVYDRRVAELEGAMDAG